MQKHSCFGRVPRLWNYGLSGGPSILPKHRETTSCSTYRNVGISFTLPSQYIEFPKLRYFRQQVIFLSTKQLHEARLHAAAFVSKAHKTICSQHIYPEKAEVYNVCVLCTEITVEKADDCVIDKMTALACRPPVRIPSLRQYSTVEGERL